ncbi:sulfur reduction protein DsrE [Cryobacterium algoritolerans]|uniref:Sulfur reduction protein DsrE n=1 Tax=Cryobacterium algoritolerans TaxID=1259184 RepID=A0A4R8WWV4_9MICO|nr:DsrE family protein [Cryobacterium algoritolerans]TFC18934.1 sulfur reduction protein DsrE [Cryobacterium algoritolerans]
MSDLKIAVVIYEPIDSDSSRVYRGLKTALEFKQAGDDVTVVFDGSGVETLAAITAPIHKMNPLAVALKDNIRGACGFCVTSHGVSDAVALGGWDLLTDYKGEVSVRNLVLEGYQILSF